MRLLRLLAEGEEDMWKIGGTPEHLNDCVAKRLKYFQPHQTDIENELQMEEHFILKAFSLNFSMQRIT